MVTAGLVYDVREVLRAHGIEPDTVALMLALKRIADGRAGTT